MVPSPLDAFIGKRILTTGSSGYIATSVHELLAEIDCTVVRHSRNPADLPRRSGRARFEDADGDLRSSGAWGGLLAGVDVVLHLAGQTSSSVANEDPARDWDANVVPVIRLLEAVRRRRERPFIVFSGTATEVGITSRIPVDESQLDAPVTVYDLHKLTAEAYIETYSRLGYAAGTTLRLPNVYGPGPPSSSGDRGVLNAIVRRALAGSSVTIYGDGAPIRDFVFVHDVARAFLAAAAQPERVAGKHYVMGTGQAHSIAEALRLVAGRVEALTGRRVPVEHVPPPGNLSPVEARDFVADPTRFRAATGWRAAVDLKEGIDRTIRHHLTLVARETTR